MFFQIVGLVVVAGIFAYGLVTYVKETHGKKKDKE